MPSGGEATVAGRGGAPSAGSSGGGGAAEAGAGAEAGASGAAPTLCDNGELPPVASLAHRYAFNGTGAVIGDAIGTAHGALIAADDSALDGNGVLVLKGGLSYVDLPNGLISSLTSATLMAWISWPQGGAAFQRIFDFGETNKGTLGEDPPWERKGDYQGVSYLAAATLSNWGPGHSFGVELKLPTSSAVNYGAFESLKDSDIHQVTVVFENKVGVRLYLDGLPKGSLSAPTARLSDIRDVNNWLGRSQTESDNPLRGLYYEFRIYDTALTECAIAGQYLAGPDSPAP